MGKIYIKNQNKCTASQLESAKCKCRCNKQCYYHIDNIEYLNKEIRKQYKLKK